MQITVKRVITAVMLAGGLVTAYQILSRPQPVATPQATEEARANAQSFDQKIEVLETARAENNPPAQVHFTSDEVSAEVAQNMGAAPAPATSSSLPPASPDAVVAQGDVQVKGYQVKLEGDVARGQFVQHCKKNSPSSASNSSCPPEWPACASRTANW